MRLPVFKYFWNNSREIQGQLEATEKESIYLYRVIVTKTKVINTNTQDTAIIDQAYTTHLGTNRDRDMFQYVRNGRMLTLKYLFYLRI